MNSSDERTEGPGRGLSRRELIVRFGGGVAGLTLASLGLPCARSYGDTPNYISLRNLLRRISTQGCDPSHGIRRGLPKVQPYISIRRVASDYAGHTVDLCAPPPSPPAPAPGGGGGGTVTTRPSINVTEQGSPQSAVFTVKGTGFVPNHAVIVRVVNDFTLAGSGFQTNSDAAGAISYGISIPCVVGVSLSFSATDERSDPQDVTGNLWSNTVTVTCA